ncbi:MAG: hypothetical protein ACE5I1_14650 [bacterium]
MSPDAGYYAYSLLAIFLVYVFIVSIIEGLKNKFHWRWGIIILLALYTFIDFGIKTKTFDFIWRKTTEFFQSGSSPTEQITQTNNMAISQKLQVYYLHNCNLHG